MERLGGDGGPIDVHEYRHGLKLRRETRETAHYENREGYACPACDREFDQLLATEKTHSSFDPSSARPFCVVREPDRLLLFRH